MTDHNAAAAQAAAAQARITELEQLARDMLSRFCRVSDGYRARAGKVQVARWEAVLDPEPAAREAHPQRIVICACTQVPELGPCPHNRQAAP